MRWVRWLVWCGLMACGAQPGGVDGGDGGAHVVAPERLTAAGYCGAVPAICAKFVQCGIAETQRGCEHTFELDPLCKHWEAAVDAGQVRFMPDAGESCLAGFLSCSPSRSTECRSAFIGTRPLGVACAEQYECAPRSYCEGLTCPGHCAARKSSGTVVEEYQEECLEGLTPILCSDFVYRCSRPLGEGYSCVGQPEFSFCGDGFFCHAATGKCRRQRKLGESCGSADFSTEDVECAWSTRCQPAGDGGYACLPLRTVGRECYANCRIDLDCRVVTDCVEPELCGRTCQPHAELGEPCQNAAVAGPVTCRWPNFCGSFDGGTYVCLPPRHFGEGCYDSVISCETGLWCAPFELADGGTGNHCLFPFADGGHQPCPVEP